MRTRLIALVAAVCALASGCRESNSHQTSPQTTNVVVASIQLPTLKCKTCVKTLTSALGTVDGVESADVDLAGKKATVKFIAAKLDVGKIRTAISNAGYDADDVKRDSSAYEDLPECCK
jgi:periplasmic mercuric ion binding protein